MQVHALLLLLVPICWAASIKPRFSIAQVSLDFGTYEGVSSNGVDAFYGLPFAEPPVGSLRLQKPQAFSTRFGSKVQDATTPKDDCMQQPLQPGTEEEAEGWALDIGSWPLPFPTAANSEDCLYLNVFRPSGTTSSSRLPVMFWIFGGGFQTGGISAYDPTSLIQTSIGMKQDIIWVGANYRLSGWGFMPGQEIQEAGVANLGLLDQRAALLWVQKYISAFGGDPAKVTIFGESAGGMSVVYQQILNGGNTQNTFRAAIMESASVFPAGTLADAQSTFDSIVEEVGCASASDKVACLRTVNNTVFQTACGNRPSTLASYGLREMSIFSPRVDGSTVPDLFPNLMYEGKFAKVPIIMGQNRDEGTIFQFASNNVTSNSDFQEYLQQLGQLPPAAVQAYIEQYPEDPSQGSPFGTGDLYNVTGQNKRIASLLTDLIFTDPRRLVSGIYLKDNIPVWSYLYEHSANTYFVGAFHGSEVSASVYGELSDVVSSQMQSTWVAFANSLNPNTGVNLQALGLPNWPQYGTGPGTQMLFGVNGTTTSILTEDNYRLGGSAVYVEYIEDLIV